MLLWWFLFQQVITSFFCASDTSCLFWCLQKHQTFLTTWRSESSRELSRSPIFVWKIILTFCQESMTACFPGVVGSIAWWNRKSVLGMKQSMQNERWRLCWGYSRSHVRGLWPWEYLKGKNLWFKVTQILFLRLLFHSYFPLSNVYFKTFLLKDLIISSFFFHCPSFFGADTSSFCYSLSSFSSHSSFCLFYCSSFLVAFFSLLAYF